MKKTLASLESILRKQRVAVGGVYVLDDLHTKPLARMIQGKQRQGERFPEAVLESVSFYARRHVPEDADGMQDLLTAAAQWWGAEAGPTPSADEVAERRRRVESKIHDLFEARYAGAYEGDWLDVDTNTYDLDPVEYLEAIAAHFGVELPPYGSNRELIDFVVSRL